MSKPEKSELQLIEWIASQHADSGEQVVTGIGDDMAVINAGRETVLITTDMLLEGVHFDLANARLSQVGYKAMAVSLSDCAAMAAIPVAAVVAVALPERMTMKDARELHKGMQQAAQQFNCPLVGGDTTSWNKPLAVNVTMLARSGASGPVLRSGARPGDAIMVTGTLGGSLGGKHLDFQPRLREAQLLTSLVEIHAMIDLSDGLATDLRHICRQSGVAALIDGESVPLSDAARKSGNPLQSALTDGEDFELLFCLSEQDVRKLLPAWSQQSELQITRIGCIIAPTGEDRLFLQTKDGERSPLKLRGWEHFVT